MQRLHKRRVQRRRYHDVVSAMPELRLLSISRVFKLGRYDHLLVSQSAGQMCGAVVPHCDFQKYLPWIALKQKVLAFARTRIVRPPPPACMRPRNMPG